MSSFKENSERASEAFNQCVKSQLQSLLSGEIVSIEQQAPNSTIAAILDQGATSDLLVILKTQGIIFTAANRIRFIKNGKELRYNFSIQLRNEFQGSSKNTELNKLRRLVMAFKTGTPVVLPRYLCFARVSKSNGTFVLHDLVAVETVPLIETVFSPSGIDLPNLRQRFGSRAKGIRHVHHNERRTYYAGIQDGTDNSFLFLHRQMLDDFAIPYLLFDNRASTPYVAAKVSKPGSERAPKSANAAATEIEYTRPKYAEDCPNCNGTGFTEDGDECNMCAQQGYVGG